ncbi:MAG: hypothetical protein V3V59_03270 [Thermodesulfovibrionales bacterium]
MWKNSIAVFMMIAAVILFGNARSFGCNVCHSRNPKMVIMHSLQENNVCFNCHGVGKIGPKEELPKQTVADPLCIECHGK